METLRLDGNNPHDVALAGEILRRGGVVAIPTETVYGLAANALDPEAVGRIFAAKGRPSDNPLIVHVDTPDRLAGLWRQVPPQAARLADAFWPGPLTMVLPRTDAVPDAVTGGLDTVGVRMPAHPVARAVIRAAGVPLAAPSANVSGRPSGTRPGHVLADFEGRIDAVVDGGDCAVGVESTVVDLTGPVAVVLRPGAVTEGDIAAVLGAATTAEAHVPEDAPPPSPGMKYTHYAPRAVVRLYTGSPEETARMLLEAEDTDGVAVLGFEEYLPRLGERYAAVLDFGPSWDHEAHAHRLFDRLREADRAGAQKIYIQAPRRHGRGAATADRLHRACGGDMVAGGGPAVLGVTGRSGSGKGVFSARMAARGALVLDADLVYRGLLESDAAMIAAILARFPGAARGDGGVDRRALGGIVFGDPATLLALNAITHPCVDRAIRARLAEAGDRPVVLDVPILFGSGADRLCTVTIGLLADQAGAVRRIMGRDGIDEQAALRRLGAQQDDAFFRRHCDLILENRGSRAQFVAQADALADRLGLFGPADE